MDAAGHGVVDAAILGEDVGEGAPAYVGLAAFQGWTRDDRTPKGADTIPVFFDWVTIKGIMQEN